MQDEMDSLAENKTWEIIQEPKYQKLVGSRWIFKVKGVIPGVEKLKYKASLVGKGVHTEG